MASYQRFAFETLPPERQRELLEKQKRQQLQREMLLEQIHEKKQRAPPPTDDDDVPRPQRQTQQQMLQQGFATTLPNNGYVPQNAEMNDQFSFPAVPALNISLPPQKPLLSERPRPQRKPYQAASLSLSPTKIHDTFTNLRHQIRSTAANAVISGNQAPLSARMNVKSTFSDDF